MGICHENVKSALFREYDLSALSQRYQFYLLWKFLMEK